MRECMGCHKIPPHSAISWMMLTARSAGNKAKKIYAETGGHSICDPPARLGRSLWAPQACAGHAKTPGGAPSTSEGRSPKNCPEPTRLWMISCNIASCGQNALPTYLDPLPRLMDANSRIHTTFNQETTATGRLSSKQPKSAKYYSGSGRNGQTDAGAALSRGQATNWSRRIIRKLNCAFWPICPVTSTCLTHSARGEDISRPHSIPWYLTFPRSSLRRIRGGWPRPSISACFYGMGANKLARELHIPSTRPKNLSNAIFQDWKGPARLLRQGFGWRKGQRPYLQPWPGAGAGFREFFPPTAIPRPAQAQRQAVNAGIQGIRRGYSQAGHAGCCP